MQADATIFAGVLPQLFDVVSATTASMVSASAWRIVARKSARPTDVAACDQRRIEERGIGGAIGSAFGPG